MKWNDTGRVCSVCNTFHPWDKFSWKRAARYQDKEPKLHQIKQPKCKECAHTETLAWRKTKTADELKDLYLKRTYGISLENYNELLIEQNCRCAICSKELDVDSWGGDSPVVDHCHTYGHVRGILCNECNRGLGYFRDNINALAQAISYLTKEDQTLEKEGAHAFYD